MHELTPFLPPALLEAQGLHALERVNADARPGQLVLKPEEVAFLAKRRVEVLRGTARVEFGEGILPRLVAAFRNSPYIAPADFAGTVNELLECFYHFKNEGMEALPDDELLAFMEEQFDGPCRGSVEYLQGTLLENLARRARFGPLWEDDLPDDADGQHHEDCDDDGESEQ